MKNILVASIITVLILTGCQGDSGDLSDDTELIKPVESKTLSETYSSSSENEMTTDTSNLSAADSASSIENADATDIENNDIPATENTDMPGASDPDNSTYNVPSEEETYELLRSNHFHQFVDAYLYYENTYYSKDEAISTPCKIIHAYKIYEHSVVEGDIDDARRLSEDGENYLLEASYLDDIMVNEFNYSVTWSWLTYMTPLITVIDDVEYVQASATSNMIDDVNYINITSLEWSTKGDILYIHFDVYRENSVYVYKGSCQYRRSDVSLDHINLSRLEIELQRRTVDEAMLVNKSTITAIDDFHANWELYPSESPLMKQTFESNSTYQMLGETENSILLYYNIWSENSSYGVYQLDKETLTILSTLELPVIDSYHLPKIKWRHDQLIIIDKTTLHLYNESLQLIESRTLPKHIQDALAVEYDYQDPNNIYVNSIDISSDLNTFVYSNNVGIYLYYVDTDTLETISEHRNYYWNSRVSIVGPIGFVGPKENIMGTIYGYESIGAKFFYDREDKVVKYFDFGGDEITYLSSLGDYASITGSSRYDSEGNRSGGATVMFNFTDLDYYYLQEALEWNDGYLQDGLSFNGVNHSFFIHKKVQKVGNSSYKPYATVYKYDLNTREYNENILLLPPSTDVIPVGVTADGMALIFCYSDGEGYIYYY